MKTQSNNLKTQKNETISRTTQTSRDNIRDAVCTPENSSMATEPQPTNSSEHDTETKGTDTLRLNVVHLLFLHGMLKNFYNHVEHEPKMQSFIHDLIIVMEIYIDKGQPSEELEKHFKYEPLETQDNG